MSKSIVTGTEMIVVVHTHWDREWYDTFERYRFALADVIDGVIEELEGDPHFRHFMLDGQTIVLEDYLAVRPEHEKRLRKLVKSGRISIGPWYLQPDEQLVSGESLVRNLLIGDRISRDFGAPMKEGYVPDTFGHIAQLPQILRGFGIDSFYSMRGTPHDIAQTTTEFIWEGPDGSRVWAHHMISYSNAAVLSPTPETTVLHHGTNIRYDGLDALRDMLRENASAPVLLLMNGNDHLRVQPAIGRIVADLNAALTRRGADRIRIGTLTDFRETSQKRSDRLEVVRGERTSGRYQKILQGVLSTRLYLKQRNDALETALSRVAEPLWAMLWCGGAEYPRSWLDLAWRTLLKNHPHDSICGCSIDRVHRDMIARFDEAGDIARTLVERGLAEIAERYRAAHPADESGVIDLVVFNPSAIERTAVVETLVDPFIGYPYGVRTFEPSGYREIELGRYRTADGAPVIVGPAELVAEDIVNRRKNVMKRRIAFRAARMPALGWSIVRLYPEEASVAKAAGSGGASGEAVPAGGFVAGPATPRGSSEPTAGWVAAADRRIENELVSVEVDSDGTLTVIDKISGRACTGMHRLEDDADRGDEYTFCGVDGDVPIVSAGLPGNVEIVDDAPLRASLLLSWTLRVPRSLTEDRAARSLETADLPVESRITVEPGSRIVRIHTTVENRARDHRMRAVFPAGFGAAHAAAESAYCVIERPIAVESGPGWVETDAPTRAQRRFVAVDAPDGGRGVAVLNRGLPEYEVTEQGEIKLTLLRSVGWLSRPDLATRPGDAGPPIETPEAQCAGTQSFDYALVLYEGGYRDAQPWIDADVFCAPPLAVRVRDVPSAKQPATQSASSLAGHVVAVRGDGIAVGAIKQSEDGHAIVVRFANLLDRPTTATVTFGVPVADVWECRLDETRVGKIEVGAPIAVGPAKIVTIAARPRNRQVAI